MSPHDHYHNPHLHHHHHHNHHENQDENRSFQSSSSARRSSHPSPNQIHTGSGNEAYDPTLGRGVDSSYHDPRHQRQSPTWASNSQYSEAASPFPSQQRSQYPRASPSLPPLRDVTNSYDQNYQSSASSYPQSYSASGLDVSSYSNERSSYYDPMHRYAQTYSQTNRPQAPAPVDYYRYSQPGIPYSTPSYTHVPSFSSSSMTLQQPSSPTVCADADSRNRKRRGNLPKPITDILRGWFHEHLDHPYPTEEDKQAFVAQTGLTINQVSNWFINARRRHLPALRQARDRGAQMGPADYDSDQMRRAHHHG